MNRTKKTAALSHLGYSICLHDEGEGGHTDTGTHCLGAVDCRDPTALYDPLTAVPLDTGDQRTWRWALGENGLLKTDTLKTRKSLILSFKGIAGKMRKTCVQNH